MHRIKQKIKVCGFTGSRAEYGLMRWLFQYIKDSEYFELQLIVGGSHLLKKYGYTYDEIVSDGFNIDFKIPFNLEGSTNTSITKSLSELANNLVRAVNELNPDLLLFMGDRYELLAVSQVGLLSGIPMAHISGGEITEGAFDDQIRHALTKISHLHFVANDIYANRVKQMGEESWRICVSGEPGLDNTNKLTLLTSKEFSYTIGMDINNPTALVTYHPVTLELEHLKDQMINIISALEKASEVLGLQFLITYPNTDPGSNLIIELWSDFVLNKSNCRLVENLGSVKYHSALRYCDCMIGNSSSGLYESPEYNLPVVNIGSRQSGRVKGGNIFDTSNDIEDIFSGINLAMNYDRSVKINNPYGDGESSERIINFILNIFSNYDKNQIMKKKFMAYDKS